MGFRVYDFKKDKDSVVTTPEIRVKFMHMEAGQIAESHGHELGVSVFLVLEGKVTFTIEGDVKELGPREMCVAHAHEKHIMLCTSREPALVYLSVTPHIQPTHTMYRSDGGKVLQRYINHAGDRTQTPFPKLVDQHIQLSQDLADSAASCARIQAQTTMRLRQAVETKDRQAAEHARGEMWAALYETYKKMFQQVEAWNALVDHLPEDFNWAEGMTSADQSK